MKYFLFLLILHLYLSIFFLYRLFVFVSVQSFPTLPVPPESPDIPIITVSYYNDVGKSVSQLRQKLEDFCIEEIEKISGRGI